MEKTIHLPKKQVKVKPNSKLDALSINEELGDIPTHFMKSGSTFRPKDQLKGLNEFKKRLIPQYASNGIGFEYDLWFNTNELNTIRRFLYTDFLGKGIYTRVNSVKINTKLFQSIVDSNIKIDEERIEKIRQNLEDKYTLQWNTEFYDKVIFLPGSNLLCKKGPDATVIDFGRMKKLIDAGYKIKPHPITAHLWMAVLKKEFGAENVLNKKDNQIPDYISSTINSILYAENNPNISFDNHFGVLRYSVPAGATVGNGETVNISGMSSKLKPDFVMLKDLSSSSGIKFWDSSRGANKMLNTDEDAVESTDDANGRPRASYSCSYCSIYHRQVTYPYRFIIFTCSSYAHPIGC